MFWLRQRIETDGILDAGPRSTFCPPPGRAPVWEGGSAQARQPPELAAPRMPNPGYLPLMTTARWVGIDAIVLSTQHNPDISLKDLREAVWKKSSDGFPSELLHADTQYLSTRPVNFVIGAR